MSKTTRFAVASSVLCLNAILCLAKPPDKEGPLPKVDDEFARAYMKTVWGARVTKDEVYLDMLKAPGMQVPRLGLTSPKLPDPFADKQLEVLGNIRGLRKLTLLDTFVAGSGLSRMANRDEITEVTIRGTPGLLEDAGARALAKFAKLEVVDLTSTRVTPKGIAELLDNKALKRVSVNTSDAMIDVFVDRGKLGLLVFGNAFGRKTLRLTSKEVSDKSLAKIRGHEGIQFLVLENTAVTDASAPNIARLGSLVGLNVTFTKFTTDGLRDLKSLGGLEEIFGLTYRTGSADAIGLFPKLKYLSMSGGDDELLKQLVKVESLEHLSIGMAKLTPESLLRLRALKNLRELRIYNHRAIPPKVRKELKDALPKCKMNIQSER